MAVFIPSELLAAGALTLLMAINGVPVAPSVLMSAGNHTITRRFPGVCAAVTIQCELDRALREEGGARRELGIIVASIDVQ